MSSATPYNTRSSARATHVADSAAPESASTQLTSEASSSATAPVKPTISPGTSAAAIDPALQAVITMLGPDGIRALLRKALTSDTAPATASPEGNPNTITTNPAIGDLHQRYSAIDPAHFRDILKNKFKPENVMKLSTSFSPTPHRKETLTLGTYTIPTIEEDHASDDYRGGIPSLMQPFEIYSQILIQFAPPGIRLDLQIALAVYRDLLYSINRTHTFESVKSFHFTFHYKRLSLGRYDPEGWRDSDSNLQMSTLRQREDSLVATTSGRGKRPFNSHHGPGGDTTRRSVISDWEKNTGSQTPTVYFDFNKGQCSRLHCSYKHICRHCYGAHPALDHDRITGGSTESDANSAPLGPPGKRH
ncbi:hypothetical protein FN846DRAFT_895504 [Sphaerosporella brunnea]|uniref:Uncharacterized protein n=1 Tax=Sphaerosporella brunnea TaxID=1250544 RepID=A0A5J5EFX1_9PEZI|nr:hypothetical protein FN846DRAFT_895504 [Sphaerosporella brunnea]